MAYPSLNDAMTRKRKLLPSTLRSAQDATLRGAVDAGGVNNSYGGNIGRIGQSPPIPDAEINAPFQQKGYDPYSSSPLRRAMTVNQSNPWQPKVGGGPPTPTFTAGRDNFTSTGRPASATIGNTPRWTMPSMLNGRVLNEGDKARIAATRARSGMDLDEQPQPASLAGAMNAAPQPQAQVPSLQNAMAGPAAPQRPSYRGDHNLVVQRAQQDSEARRLRMSGVRSPLAAVMAGGDSNARNLAMGGRQYAAQIDANQGLGGLREAQAGLATAQSADLAQRGQMLKDPSTRQQARIDAALQSDNPQIQAWAMSQMTQANSQPGGASLQNAWNLPPVTRDEEGTLPEADIKRILDRLPDKIDNPTAALQQMQQLGVDKADLEQHFDENREPSLMDSWLSKVPDWMTNAPTAAMATNPFFLPSLPVAMGLGRTLRTSRSQAKRRIDTQKANAQKLGSLGVK